MSIFKGFILFLSVMVTSDFAVNKNIKFRNSQSSCMHYQ